MIVYKYREGKFKYYVITFRDILNPPTVSSFSTLVGGAYLMTSYLNKNFKSVPVCCRFLSAKK